MRKETWSDNDELSDDDWDDDEDDLTVPCPYCGEELLEDSPRCPACGGYTSEEDRPPERKPSWIVVGIVICLVIALAWAAGW
uniref:Zinc ribbon domain-containing protein n=1 Tax=Schlesneria paludicola TaxID=360056 RepID=A0A7C2JWT0_9PLAN